MGNPFISLLDSKVEMTSHQERREELVFAARFSVYSNTVLVLLKLIVGLAMSSIAVISEAIHSGTDLVAALIANFSVRKSTKLADEDHKFGHGKYESFSGTIEAALIFVAAIIIIYEAALKLMEDAPVRIIEAGIVVMAISATLNFAVSRYLLKVAKKHESLALEADGLHLKTDVWTSVGVFFGLVIVRITNIQAIDPIFGMIVAVIIIGVSVRLTRRSALELLDHSLTQDEEKVILTTITEVTGELASFHGLRTRRSGHERFVDFHLVVPKHLEVETAHRICDDIEKKVVDKLPNSNITIHIEPCSEECEGCKNAPICKGAH